jgi:uracil-DNA glycosylase
MEAVNRHFLTAIRIGFGAHASLRTRIFSECHYGATQLVSNLQSIKRHQAHVRKCIRCPDMNGPPVTGTAVVSPVLLIGQAPGAREIQAHKPFVWTAGKTLFGWFESIGMDEEAFRSRVYMAAVCRCFPGKAEKGGDRVPRPDEIENCSGWLKTELKLLRPELILPAGKLAITQLMPVDKLSDAVGSRYRITVHGITADVVPLPHPSGASTWHRLEPGKSLLAKALRIIERHPAWEEIRAADSG